MRHYNQEWREGLDVEPYIRPEMIFDHTGGLNAPYELRFTRPKFCPECNRDMSYRSRSHIFMDIYSNKCPYCGCDWSEYY